jgi:hypothetical protein
VETEDPSACSAVNCKVCKSAIVPVVNVINIDCNQSANKSNHLNLNLSSFRRSYHPTHDNSYN